MERWLTALLAERQALRHSYDEMKVAYDDCADKEQERLLEARRESWEACREAIMQKIAQVWVRMPRQMLLEAIRNLPFLEA